MIWMGAEAPIDRWNGDRDDAALGPLADALGIRGPVQRLRAALDLIAR